MNLDRSYAKQVRQHLSFFPVWPPGDSVAPGDVGLLKGGLFYRQGTLAETIGELTVKVTPRPMTGLTRFRSSDCSTTGVKASGGAPVATGITANAQLTLSFANAGGVAFDAADCTEQTIANVLEVRDCIQSRRALWPSRDFVLITRVTLARNFLVVVAGVAGASVELSGDANALGAWNLANASVSSSAGNSGGYQRGGAGPVLIGLYGFNWWKWWTETGGIEPLSIGASTPAHTEQDFIELPARHAAFDQ
jgi:hypothetical protein